MSDWDFINKHRVREGIFANDASFGFNGAACFVLNGLPVKVIFSDGQNWQHVSVSIHGKPNLIPSWQLICKIKELFWEPDQTVVQFHPAKKDYVNYHPGCLHLWRYTAGEFPTPDPLMVGPKGIESCS